MDLPEEIIGWVEATAGGRLTGAKQMPGGARKEAWFVDIALDDGTTSPLFLRYDRSDPSRTGDPWTLRREALVYLALQATDVRVPRVLGVHPELQAMLSERVEGQTWFSQITDPAEQESVAKDFMGQLAALHRIDVASLDLPVFPAPTSLADLVHWQLDEMEDVIAFRGGQVDPQLAFSLRWLRANVPDADGPIVLVQGDTGPGNFMYAGGQVVAVVDWELAHLGDPMDDIAWLSLRATQEPFTDFPQRLREYEDLTGIAIDEQRVHYYRVLAEAKILTMGHRPAAADGESRGRAPAEVGNMLIYGMLHRRLWFEAIAASIDLELDPPAAGPEGVDADDWLYDVVLDDLREVIVPNIADPFAQRRAKGLARIVKALKESARRRPTDEAAELADLTALLGATPASITEGRAAAVAAVEAGTIAERDYLAYAWRRTARENEAMRPASGALADRHWPPLK